MNKQDLIRSVSLGLVAGASIIAVTSVVGRIPAVNATLPRRLAGSLALAGGAAHGAMLLKAPQVVSDGIIAGAVAMAVLQITVSAIGSRRLDPPPVADARRLGDPWPPQMPYAVHSLY